MIVYRPTDKLTVKIGDISVKISPLTYEQKTEIMTHIKMEKGETVANSGKMMFLTLKYSVKEVSGLPEMKYADGSKAELTWSNGSLTEEGLELFIQALGFSHASVLSSGIFVGDFSAMKDVVFEAQKKT